jgi:catechol 2,3-dioxygenase-like lactoylglutathione lyase family enzyme
MAELPPAPEGIVLAHFIVSDDVERSRRFYTEVLGGRVERPGDVSIQGFSVERVTRHAVRGA